MTSKQDQQNQSGGYTDFIINSIEEISFKEQFIIFYSIIKWTFLATIIGAIVGAGVYYFMECIRLSFAHTSQYTYYYFFLPLVFFINYIFVKWVPDIEGHGTEKVIGAIHKKNGDIKWQVVPLKILTTVMTLAFGGSAGKEGPAAQIGGGLASMLGKLARLTPEDRKKLVICGISGGFAAVFGTPIAGSIFAVEVLFVGTMLYDVLLPSFVAGITAYQVSSFLGAEYVYHKLNFVPIFSESFFIKVILAGAFFGICSFLLIEILKFFEALAKKMKPYKRSFIGGLAIIIMTLVFSTDYLGLGMGIIERSLRGEMNMWYVFLLKIVFTSVTLSFFGSGGIVTPIFFIGATSGTLFADLFDLNRQTFAALGFVGVLSGAANTPIAASIMAIEMFGKDIAPYACLACVVSFLITGYRSVYPSQIISSEKCDLVKSAIGKEIIKVHPEVAEDDVQKTLIRDTHNFAEAIKNKLNFIEDFMRFYKRRGRKNK